MLRYTIVYYDMQHDDDMIYIYTDAITSLPPCSREGSLWRWDAAHAMELGHSNRKVHIEHSYIMSREGII